MDNQTHNQIVNLIWSIADDCLRDVIGRSKYREVILPMVVIRRLDSVLEDTKEEVLKTKAMLEEAGVVNTTDALCNAAGQSFCNSSPFKLKDLTSRSQQQKLQADFEAYLDGFSSNVQEILEKMKFRIQIPDMIEGDVLGLVIEKFVSPTINLSPYPILDDLGEVKIPALDNHGMGTIFEELIRRFNEEMNEDAGEHYTPRDAIYLMADCIFAPIADKIQSTTYSCYDPTCGTGGMLTIAQERLTELAEKDGKTVSIHLFGQESAGGTYAITKADMILKGEGAEAENIVYGSTLSKDGFPTKQFDFMFANPPYGTSWKKDAKKMGGKDEITDRRFVTSFAGEEEFRMLTAVDDGQLLFLLNNVAKMKETTELGARIAEVHNGSSLFTGGAGSGESNARRYMIERDLVECIIALPENMFYNTGIGTFIWILSNRKEARRRGKIQLIDATKMKSPLRKNMGHKNCEMTPEIRSDVLKLFMDFQDIEYSKIFPNEEFGYYKVPILRPLRQWVRVDEETVKETISLLVQNGVNFASSVDDCHIPCDFLEFVSQNTSSRSLKIPPTLGKVQADIMFGYFVRILIDLMSLTPYSNEKEFEKAFNSHSLSKEEKLKYSTFKKFMIFCVENSPDAEIVYDKNGNALPDKSLTDSETIPMLYEGGKEAFFEKEIKPFAPDSWMDEKNIKVGYELSFTKYFYKPVQLREVEDIVADIRALEQETDGLLAEIIGG